MKVFGLPRYSYIRLVRATCECAKLGYLRASSSHMSRSMSSNRIANERHPNVTSFWHIGRGEEGREGGSEGEGREEEEGEGRRGGGKGWEGIEGGNRGEGIEGRG